MCVIIIGTHISTMSFNRHAFFNFHISEVKLDFFENLGCKIKVTLKHFKYVAPNTNSFK